MEKVISVSIPAHIRNLLHCGETGEVILVSSSGIYLRFGEQILLLCDQKWGTLPIGIGVADFDHVVSLLRLQQGQKVGISENGLVFQSGSIRFTTQETVCRTRCNRPLQSQHIRQAAEELASLHKTRGISMLVLPLVLGCAQEAVWNQNPYCEHGYIHLRKLIAALAHRDDPEIRSCVEKLLGLGPGLTPSADDCLLGMLYVFRALPRKAPEGAAWFQECIAKLCDCRTNQISAAYLKAILAGAPFERMEQVFRGLCGEETLDIWKLTQIGSSSGSEMLLGMLIALKLCGYDVSQREELQ